MFSWTKKTKKEIEAIRDDSSIEEVPQFTEEEQELTSRIIADYMDSSSSRKSSDETGRSIEDNWEDDYKLYKGKGLQWSTTFAYRSKKAMSNRPNSEDNFIFNTIEVQKSNITANIPEINIGGVEDSDNEIADKLTFASRFNDEKNKFRETFKKWVHDFCTSGPTIGYVAWDNSWIGGRGAKRWIGDVRLLRVAKEEIYFDPAILDLEENLQDCGYIIRRVRKKLQYIRQNWENGKYVGNQYNEDEYVDEGANPESTYLIEYWHRGYPYHMTKEREKELKETAKRVSLEDGYKAKDYEDAAKGVLEGIHVAYFADDVLLEYRAYEYEDGLYPFVFTTKYQDDKCQWGFGEIRNLSIPQVMHNKADEIELEAMSKEGLGGHYYQKGAISKGQKNLILENSALGGQWFEVDNVAQIKPREGVRVPNSIREYKQNKERIINAIQPATTIQQGISPGSNVPYSTVKELGNRTDVRMKQVSDKLEDFLIKINQLRINRFEQFYTEERYYRIRGADNKITQGTLRNDEMKKTWVRDTVQQENPTTGLMEQKDLIETFVPEFDIKVTIMSEKPTDRNYYTQLANVLYDKQLLSPEDFYFCLEEGKLPPIKDILKHLYARQPILAVLSKIQELPEEIQQQILDTLKQSIQQAQQTQMMSIQNQNMNGEM
jgi:hypothetical protein